MRAYLCIGLLCSVWMISGCWDRTEINDLAFISGTSFDLTDTGECCLLSVQIAIPSSSQGGLGGGGSGQQEKFFVLSAVGKNTSDAFQKIQMKSSRRLFTSHRSVIFIGESFGRHGINEVLDVFTHDPRQRLRTYIMVVKGGEGREILQTKYPFEQLPIEAVKEMEGLGTELAVTLRDFFITAASEGISPVMGVIEAKDYSGGNQEKNKIFKLAGSALFKDFKIIGFLDSKQTNGFAWATNRKKSGEIDASLPNGNGNVGMQLNHAKRTITSRIIGDKIQVKIQLQGEGSLLENNTDLNINRPNNLKLVKQALEKSVETEVREVVADLQKRYKVDAIGFGQEIFRDHPKQWKALKEQWDLKYPQVDLAIGVKLNISGSGMSGTPLQLKEKEIKK
ncbi:Ger(x)C family spore germination protein [Paenibacillus sp. R14(2021)]|uniref:Ger(x)C family spore germination protein n=1 Tax=Paenibacillus sp. R14(2021) TaxID=2859228 RepID=UPI001C6123F6|nr:Ger(x)C family spore germination protein [Paenibacillus sp. R14(2021)]